MTDKTGRCLCGSVVYKGVNIQPQVHVCHCADCRRWTGGPFMGVHFDRVEIANPSTVNWFRSSDWASRGSCATCGTALFYRLESQPETPFVAAGSLDDAAGLTSIAEHIFIDSKPDYYDFAGDAPRVTGAEVFARFQAGQSDE